MMPTPRAAQWRRKAAHWLKNRYWVKRTASRAGASSRRRAARAAGSRRRRGSGQAAQGAPPWRALSTQKQA